MIVKITEKLKHNWKFVLIVLALASFIVNVLLFYPGYMSTDSLTNLNQATGAGPITSLQPVIEPLVWKVLIKITGQISSMLFLQLFFLWSALLLISIFVWNKTKKIILSLLPLAIGFLPNVINISGVIWSDNQMAFSFLLAVAIFLNLEFIDGKIIKRLALLASFLLIMYAGLVRYNAILAAIPVIFLFICKTRSFKRKSHIAIAAVGMMFFIVISSLVIKAVFTERYITNTAGPMMDDIVHTLSTEEIAARPISDSLKESLIKIKNCAQEKGIIIDSFPCGAEQDKTNVLVLYPNDISKAWRWAVTHRTLSYLRYKATAFTYVLFPPQGRGYIWHEGINANNFNLTPAFNELGQVNRMYVFNFGYKHFQSFYEPWLWFFLSFGLLIYSRHLKKVRIFVALLSLSAFMHILSFIPTGVAADYRYIYWPVLATSTAIILIFVEKKFVILKNR